MKITNAVNDIVQIPARFTLRANHKLDEPSLSKLAALLHALESNPADAKALQDIQDDGLYLAVAGNMELFRDMLQSPGIELIDNEASALSKCEQVIERGQQSFFEVGEALAQIRVQKLYRAGFKTFEDYCEKRWGWKRQHAYRLIKAAGVVSDLCSTGDKPDLSPIGDKSNSGSAQELKIAVPKPTNESQVRPLTKLPRAERRGAWMEACEESGGHQPTAEKVAEVVDRRLINARPTEEPNSQPPGEADSEATAQDDAFVVAVCYDEDAKALLKQHRNIVLIVLSLIENLKAGSQKSLCSVIAKGTVPEQEVPLDLASSTPRTALENSWPDALRLSPGLPERKDWRADY